MARERSLLVSALLDRQPELHAEWMAELRASGSQKDLRMGEAELKAQTGELLRLLGEALSQNGSGDVTAPEWKAVRGYLNEISRSRVHQGFESNQTATFIFSLKKPIFARVRDAAGNNTDLLASQTWAATELLDQLGLHTMKAYEKSREEVINRQQEELLELSTPVIKVWDGVLALPMIGTLDSARTQIVMESLLQRIVETGSAIAIIDITGVPTVDTVVAQHLIKTVTAIRLMGADCIISGIRPQIAQTIVHLGIDLHGVLTKANLADALSVALRRSGFVVTRGGATPDARNESGGFGASTGTNGSQPAVPPAARGASSGSRAGAGG
jgi:rsbT co-antagonist protein RsbR